MNKTAIKNYAIWARVQLIESCKQRAYEYGVTEDGNYSPNMKTVGSRILTDQESVQRNQLIDQIRQKGYEQVMEEAAYTWFNRFIALRFMEVNGYLPSKVRVFTDETGAFKPEILKEAMTIELEGIDRSIVIELLEKQDNEELYKYLLITQCNALSDSLPYMFEIISDWTELLFPTNLTRSDSILGQMISSIAEEDWTNQVQIIGWLYESYTYEKNQQVYDGTLSKEKISKELLPAATTIFTPDWPVHYMVENSLGRLWLEGHPNETLKSSWKYYLEEAEQEAEVQAQLDYIFKEYASLKPEDIRVIDPCMGSGHILCVLFDVLFCIYENYGYSSREAVACIVEKNLWGLDVDDRAGQLAYFAVMMKARQYDRRFFSRKIQPNVYAIRETNAFQEGYYHAKKSFSLSRECEETLSYIMDVFFDAKEYGSILKMEEKDYIGLRDAWNTMISQADSYNDITIWSASVTSEIPLLINQAIALSQKYHVVVTNPPYLGNTRFSPLLDKYIKENYAEVKSDLSMVMYKHALDDMTINNGFISFITTSSWMFLASFEKLRNYLYQTVSFSSLVDYGTELFEGKVGHNPIVSWVVRKKHINSKITAIRLVEYCYSRRDEKEAEFFNNRNRYITIQSSFEKVPGSPIAYWLSESFIRAFNEGILLGALADSKQGLATADNNRFLRLWEEVDFNKVKLDAVSHEDAKNSLKKWFPYNKGGDFRRWYGNNDYLVNWENDGFEIKHIVDEKGKLRSRPQNLEYMFKPSASWSLVSSASAAFRYKPPGHLFDIGGMSFFSNNNLFYLLGLANTKIVYKMLEVLAPTINFQCGDIAKIPVYLCEDQQIISCIVERNIALSKTDWDSFETSWDFKKHPLV